MCTGVHSSVTKWCIVGYLGLHYNDVIMNAMTSQITSHMVVYSTIYSGTDQRRQQSSASLAFVRGIHRWRVNSPHKGPVTQKNPFTDVITRCALYQMLYFTTVIFLCRSQKPQFAMKRSATASDVTSYHNEYFEFWFESNPVPVAVLSGTFDVRADCGLGPANTRRRYKVTPSLIG